MYRIGIQSGDYVYQSGEFPPDCTIHGSNPVIEILTGLDYQIGTSDAHPVMNCQIGDNSKLAVSYRIGLYSSVYLVYYQIGCSGNMSPCWVTFPSGRTLPGWSSKVIPYYRIGF